MKDMLECVAASSVLIAVLLVLRRVFRGKLGARVQYALWALVALRLLLPVPLAGSPISVMNVMESSVQGFSGINLRFSEEKHFSPAEGEVPPSEQGQQALISSKASLAAPEGTAKGDISSRKAASSLPVVPAVPEGQRGIFEVLFVVWAMGAGTVGLCFLFSNLRFGWELKKRRYKMEPEGFPLPVYLVEGLPSPCLFGFLRPAVYLTPESLKTAERKNHVLLHEYTHFRHGDLLWAVVRGLCLSLHWFNPFVWAAALCSKTDCELACDEGAVKKLGPEHRLDYGRTLVDLISTRPSPGELLCTATTMTSGKKAIQTRIANLAKKPKRLVMPLVAVLLVACLTVGCTFTGAQEFSSQVDASQSTSEDEEETLETDVEALLADGTLTLCWRSGTGEGQSAQMAGDELWQELEALITDYQWESVEEVSETTELGEQLLLSNSKGDSFVLCYRQSGLVYWETDGVGQWYSAQAKNREQEELFGDALWESIYYLPRQTEEAFSDIFLEAEAGKTLLELAQLYAERIQEDPSAQIAFLLGRGSKAEDFQIQGCELSERAVNDGSIFVFTVQLAIKPQEGSSLGEGYEAGAGQYEGYGLYRVKYLMKRQGDLWRCLMRSPTAENYSLLASFLGIQESEVLQGPEVGGNVIQIPGIKDFPESSEADYPLPPAKNLEESSLSSETQPTPKEPEKKDGIQMTLEDVIAFSENWDAVTWEVLEPYAQVISTPVTADGSTETRCKYVIDDVWFLQAIGKKNDLSPREIRLGAFHGGAMDLDDVRTNDVKELIEVRLEANEKHGYTQPGPNNQEPQRTGIYTISIPVKEGEGAQDTAERFLEEWFQNWNNTVQPGHDDQILDYVIRHVEVVEEGENAFVFGFGYSLLPEHENSMYLWAGNTKPDPEREGWLSMNRTGILEQVDGFWEVYTIGTGADLSLQKVMD